ncbi:MAG: (R)-specific enoyl-CoA hydratase RipB/Ich [Rhodothalassiaceae bacterium]
MTHSHEEIGPQRFRESFGRWFDDFRVGDIYEHRPGRTITESDNTWFSLLTMNTHPLHFDAEYAKKSEFGRPLVVSSFTVALLLGMSVTDISQKAIANLGWKEIRMTAPVFVGDTLYAESEVLDCRLSKSRPGQGIVTVRTTGRNQHGVAVCDFVRSVLVPQKGHGIPD